MPEQIAPLGASPRTVRAVPILDLPRRDVGRGVVQFAIDPLGAPLLWCAERVDTGYYPRGVFRFLVFGDKAVSRLPIPRRRRLAPG
ncbi:MAG TPA: hypothetical protein VFD32_13760 [Dehalococcoidia bacterium]|nr:hypothetical protein [Dehalococcoidia bacterium]